MLPKERRWLLGHFDLDGSVARGAAVVVGGETPAGVARSGTGLRDEASEVEALAGAVFVLNLSGTEPEAQILVGYDFRKGVLDVEKYEIIDTVLSVGILCGVPETAGIGTSLDVVVDRNDLNSAHTNTSLKYSSHTTRSIR